MKTFFKLFKQKPPMFIIKWRTQPTRIITGLSKYPTLAAAEKQRDLWQWLFPDNRYYIETAE